jgi:hypothetical protein
MRKEIDYRELFKRFAEPEERLDDNWIEYIDEKMSAQGQLIARHEWGGGGPELVLVWWMFINFEICFSLRMTSAIMVHTKGSLRRLKPLRF